MEPLCKACQQRPAHPKYHGLCSQCRTERYAYSKGKQCVSCGTPVSNHATKCSACAAFDRHVRVDRQCQECGKHYLAKPSDRKVYCSRACKSAADRKRLSRKADGAMAWKGRETVGHDGYVSAYHYERRRRVYVHVQIAERVLGRRLRKGEVVHHINGDRTDNRHCNLLICDQAYHRWLHSHENQIKAANLLGSQP